MTGAGGRHCVRFSNNKHIKIETSLRLIFFLKGLGVRGEIRDYGIINVIFDALPYLPNCRLLVPPVVRCHDLEAWGRCTGRGARRGALRPIQKWIQNWTHKHLFNC